MVLKKIRALLGRKPGRAAAAAAEAAPAAPAANVPAVVPVHRGPEVVHHPVALQDLDADAVRIVKRLARFDHTAYLVGGCVRDLLLERKPKDFDIGTSATPRQIKRLFSNCRIIGRRFRLAHIYFQNGKIIEVATFRAKDNGAEADEAAAAATAAPAVEADDILIRDDNVFGTPEEDALRRDFTINALFYDVNAETVIDHADGLSDLRRKLVRTIGDPAVRFREDPIRILRAIKFAARLDFAIESGTLAALTATRGEIPKAAPPRVLEEFNRFCRGGAGRRSFELCFETGVFEIILPEVASLYAENGAERRALLALLDAIDRRWAAGAAVGTAEIFSALLFAAAAPQLGWPLGGEERREPRGDVRGIIEAVLRPIALRLRLSRRDQEHTRQTLIILQRMVPWKPLRRGTRHTLMRRPAFADALAMLDALGPVLGGIFAESATAWRESLDEPGAQAVPAHEAAHEAAHERPAEGTNGGERRRRGRRGGRRRHREREESPSAPASSPAPAPVRAATMPPVWDDNYFFAALPSVPKRHTESSDGDTDRYGADVVAASPTPVEPHTNPSPRKARRRRGGRGRRKPGPILPDGDSSSPDGGES
ncbi:MAG TPA: CCA tRNA nucleotidyltransferase [Candidatus Polarisedimenticolaceae bacterium]|nr:CCA tRNA nucleotidyltransferase [Candidatus Polarisedimenticolaceae bacterium]